MPSAVVVERTRRICAVAGSEVDGGAAVLLREDGVLRAVVGEGLPGAEAWLVECARAWAADAGEVWDRVRRPDGAWALLGVPLIGAGGSRLGFLVLASRRELGPEGAPVRRARDLAPIAAAALEAPLAGGADRAADEDVRAWDERLAVALRAAGAGAWDCDLRTQRTWVGGPWCEQMGYDGPVPVPAERFLEHVHPDDAGPMREQFRRCMAGATGEIHAEFRAVGGGRVRWLMSVGRVVERDAEGRPVRLVGVNTDVTALKEAQASAEAANAAKSAFLASLSHEIRTPMTAILGYADLLAQGSADEESRRHAETIRRNGRHLLRILNDVLDLSKIEAGRLEVAAERCGVGELIDGAASLFAAQASALGIALRVRRLSALPSTALTDPTRVTQVLANLLSNAVKFSKGGEVVVEASYRGEGGAEGASGVLRVDVIDRGPGVPEEERGKLFEAFAQGLAGTAGGGSGLGLAIARRLARLLGGDVTLEETSPEAGSRFRMEVRLTGVRWGTEPRAEEDPEPAGAIAGRRVLVVEDAEDSARLLEHMLVRMGLEVACVGNGVRALHAVDLAEGEGRAFDLVLMDMQMPVLDGYAAVSELRRRGVRTPVIALTARAMEEDRERCLAAGCNDYAAKPITREELERVVRRWIAGVPAASER